MEIFHFHSAFWCAPSELKSEMSHPLFPSWLLRILPSVTSLIILIFHGTSAEARPHQSYHYVFPNSYYPEALNAQENQRFQNTKFSVPQNSYRDGYLHHNLQDSSSHKHSARLPSRNPESLQQNLKFPGRHSGVKREKYMEMGGMLCHWTWN